MLAANGTFAIIVEEIKYKASPFIFLFLFCEESSNLTISYAVTFVLRRGKSSVGGRGGGGQTNIEQTTYITWIQFSLAVRWNS